MPFERKSPIAALVLCVVSSLGCAPSTPAHAVPPATIPTSRVLEATCMNAAVYTPATIGALTELQVVLRTHLSTYFVQTNVCLLLDGAPMFSPKDAHEIVDQLTRGETVTRQVQVAQGGQHELQALMFLSGTGRFRQYWFVSRSSRRVTFEGGPEGGRLEVRMRDIPAPSLEQRPSIAWESMGGVTLTRPPQPTATPAPSGVSTHDDASTK